MGKKTIAKKYSCLKCGSPFDAYPPDDSHDTATRDPNKYEDQIKVDYRCKDCGYVNTIYWADVPPSVAIL